MMSEQKNTVKIDETEYDVNDMEPTEQSLVMQIKDVREKIRRMNFDLTQLQAAQTTLTSSLARAITDKDAK